VESERSKKKFVLVGRVLDVSARKSVEPRDEALDLDVELLRCIAHVLKLAVESACSVVGGIALGSRPP
jgi:hypothetical protein